MTWAAAAVAIVVVAGGLAGAFRWKRRRPHAITPEGFRRALDAMSPESRRGGEGPTDVPTAIDSHGVRVEAKRRRGMDMPDNEPG